MKSAIVRSLVLCLLAGAGRSVTADEALTQEQTKFFESKIRPVLVRECYSCHSSEVGQVRGGLWLDTADAMRTGGDSGPAIVPGNLDDSLLWNAINHIDYVMPPRRKLSDEILADFRTWIEMGAPDPRVTAELHVRSGITPEDIAQGREFWAFKAPVQPSVPKVDSPWAWTDIDRFVAAKQAEHALAPSKDVDSLTLLRRLTFDLIGLPPTPEQTQQFAKDYSRDADQAVTEMVDHLLAQPQFGERWGRHWLDLARYAESTGREVNLTFPHAWRYRDYVIDAFNKDKPYDRFLQEQIAGDLLPAKNDQQWSEQLVATGFLTLGPKALNEQNGRQFELDLIDEQIDVTTRVMLGVSVACARCHDHKFDPIPQTDYYALSGIFRGMSTHYGTFRSQQNRRPSNLIMLPIEDPNYFDESLTVAQLEAIKSEARGKQAELREAFAARLQRRNDSSKTPAQSIAQIGQLSVAAGLLQAKIDSYDRDGNPLSLCMAVQETTPTNARLLERGEFNKPAQEVPRGFPQVLCSTPAQIPNRSTGRLEFARWVGSSDNPLAARVMVNRIWQHLIGQAIVRTPEDFGSTGQPPTHPELLDYLAVQFMAHDWSVKQLIRSITLSRTYRMDSAFEAGSFEKDPDNRYLWRIQPKRLEAEAIRDSLLAASGELDSVRPRGSLVARAGTALVRDGSLLSLGAANESKEGPSGPLGRIQQQVAGNMAANVLGTELLKPSVESLDRALLYRSVYLPVVRDNIPRTLGVFDFAESTMVIGQRETSNTPDQGLFFLNNSFVIDRAAAMAKRVASQADSVNDRIKLAFLIAYGRPASQVEIRAAHDFYSGYDVQSPQPSRGAAGRRPGPFGGPFSLGSTAANASSPEVQKLAALCQSIMASAEFRFVN